MTEEQLTLFEKLNQEMSDMYDNLKAPLSTETEELTIELENRGIWLARSSEILSQVQWLNDVARGEAAEKNLTIPSATLLREIINRDTALYRRSLTLAEKLNSTIVHQIDLIRSKLSFEKQLAANSMRGTSA